MFKPFIAAHGRLIAAYYSAPGLTAAREPARRVLQSVPETRIFTLELAPEPPIFVEPTELEGYYKKGSSKLRPSVRDTYKNLHNFAATGPFRAKLGW